MCSETVRAAILGMGNMGKQHANSLRRIEGVEVVAYCSSSIEDARRYVKENNLNAPAYDDFYRMLDEVRLDALFVCLPPYAHSGQIEAAAAKKINIFVEKPISLTVERGELIARAVRENGVKSQVGYHMRFGGAVRRFKELIDSGIAGKPALYSARYECNSLHSRWWMDVEKSGGQVFEQVIHLYDMALYLMGDVSHVSGFMDNLCHTDVPGYTVEDTSSAILRFKSGALGNITGSNCAVPGQWNGFFRVVCKNMVADFIDHNHATFIYTDGNSVREENVVEDVNVGFDEVGYFIDVLKGKASEFAPIAEGLKGLRLVQSVVDSSKNNGAMILL